jgi:nucleoside-diphosphate kinase
MSENLTFAIIKPDAFKSEHSGSIIKMIEKAEFKLLEMKLVSLTKEKASEFYKIHKEKPFYNRLCDYMSSGPIIVMKLSKNNAIEDFRKLIGSTNPQDAAEGTIRNLFATSIEANAIHGSDSNENAVIESDFFFNT